MSKFKTEIRKDIKVCEELLEKDSYTSNDYYYMVGKYLIDYPNFADGFVDYIDIMGKEVNTKENLMILKGKLEYLLARTDNPELYKSVKSPQAISINNSLNNSNSVHIYMEIDDIQKNIEDNTYLGTNDKEELLNKLKEIESLQKSNDSKSKKWDIAKKILAFVMDKGADIAIMYIPQILKAIS